MKDQPLKIIDQANQEALRRIIAGEPILIDVIPAAQAIAELADDVILHAGPPIGWDRMCGPLRGAIMGIAVFEGWATDLGDAATKAAAGSYAFRPNHHYGAVGPMTGMTTASQPLLVVENLRTYFTLDSGTVKAVDGVSFSLQHGEALGIAGESGCGKTTTALSLVQILPSNAKIVDIGADEIARITGQKPVTRRAKKSIAAFKVRKGMPIGTMVTLRGERMWDFLDRLIAVALPRVRDFRGVSPRGFDGRGNYTLGLKDQLLFPEIDYMKVDKARGMNISVVTTAKSDEESRKLLQLLGMPFRTQQ